MWIFAFAVIALIVGNVLRKVGIEASRANSYGSAASLAGQRKSSIGTLVNIAGGIGLVVAAFLFWL